MSGPRPKSTPQAGPSGNRHAASGRTYPAPAPDRRAPERRSDEPRRGASAHARPAAAHARPAAPREHDARGRADEPGRRTTAPARHQEAFQRSTGGAARRVVGDSTALPVPARAGHAESGGGTFADLKLIKPLLQAVHDQGYTEPTPIQVQAIPHVLAGRDLLGCARTGTGKTAGFALPMLQLLSHGGQRANPRTVRSLVLVPTRELASQVAQSFQEYGRGLQMSVAVIFGGVPQGAQVRALERGLDVLVATPGRLVDLMGQRHARLDGVEILVLDEADHMLDLGFLPDVKRIIAALPKRRQTLFFSATMPPAISQLAETILAKPEKVFVTPAASTVEQVDQCVHFVDRGGKPELLRRILSGPDVGRALVFTRTKRGSDKVAKKLSQDGIPALAIHGNKTQGNRERTLAGFRDGRTRVLVATDIAARGIDVDAITHVINYELPNVPETYVHRIGRTARAGATGIAIALCDGEERAFLRDIENLIRTKVRVASGSAAALAHVPPAPKRGGSNRSMGPGRARGGAPARGGSRPQGGGQGARSSGARPARSGVPHRAAKPASPPTRQHGGSSSGEFGRGL